MAKLSPKTVDKLATELEVSPATIQRLAATYGPKEIRSCIKSFYAMWNDMDDTEQRFWVRAARNLKGR